MKEAKDTKNKVANNTKSKHGDSSVGILDAVFFAVEIALFILLARSFNVGEMWLVCVACFALLIILSIFSYLRFSSSKPSHHAVVALCVLPFVKAGLMELCGALLRDAPLWTTRGVMIILLVLVDLVVFALMARRKMSMSHVCYIAVNVIVSYLTLVVPYLITTFTINSGNASKIATGEVLEFLGGQMLYVIPNAVFMGACWYFHKQAIKQ